jgi:hypothetical protein
VALAALTGAGWMVGSAATVTVTPKNHSAFQTCVLTAYPTATTVEADSWVDESNKTAKKGTSTTISIQSRSTKNYRGFVRFDLTKCNTPIPASATVRSATVRLNLSLAPVGTNRTLNLNRVTGPCPEAATTCWTEANITWNNQPTVAAAPTSAVTVGTATSTGTYFGFDATADVAAMVAGTASNYGWRITDSVENAATTYSVNFKSRELTANAAGAPQLVVVYTP